MAQKTLNELFDSFLSQQPHFSRKDALQETYTPESLPHREEQMNQLASILAPALRGEKPSNIFLYGKTGTGKTAASKYVGQELEKKAAERGTILRTSYINCKMEKVNTTYRVLSRFFMDMNFKGEAELPVTGLPTDVIYRKLVSALDKNAGVYLLLLDEIDAITDPDVLYDLTRINTDLKNAKISIIGISNDLSFTNTLDPRIKSSLSEEELVFPPYNAIQLQDILTQRAQIALQAGVLEGATIPKCAALAAQEHGDARRALDLLRVACEIAERNGETKTTEAHVSMAQKKLDIDRVIEVAKTQPRQSQLVLYSIVYLHDLNKEDIGTGEVYEVYQNFCKQSGLDSLTQRRVSDLISELDMLSLISTSVISKGRYGRTRKIKLEINGTALDRCREVLNRELL
ncbi:MAG: ORC1-type DNA replication protein [archaeon]